MQEFFEIQNYFEENFLKSKCMKMKKLCNVYTTFVLNELKKEATAAYAVIFSDTLLLSPASPCAAHRARRQLLNFRNNAAAHRQQ